MAITPLYSHHPHQPQRRSGSGEGGLIPGAGGKGGHGRPPSVHRVEMEMPARGACARIPPGCFEVGNGIDPAPRPLLKLG